MLRASKYSATVDTSSLELVEDPVKDGYRGLTALVTGASRGLGRAYAEELVRRGARVILLARSERDLRELAGQLNERHGGRGDRRRPHHRGRPGAGPAGAARPRPDRRPVAQ
ncbi:SDR family NAD(P)-dependent oxidoreductase [Amycolatopsis sp. NPDC059021]|uniref:SDR family NAD(P)-dependent oxidoreductase n=1 Tax=Amycolatopsis sp. NPDC059021 TaxID=3346704 RepID=UPI00366E4D18